MNVRIAGPPSEENQGDEQIDGEQKQHGHQKRNYNLQKTPENRTVRDSSIILTL